MGLQQKLVVCIIFLFVALQKLMKGEINGIEIVPAVLPCLAFRNLIYFFKLINLEIVRVHKTKWEVLYAKNMTSSCEYVFPRF